MESDGSGSKISVNEIIVESTSAVTATIRPIVLKLTDRVQLTFEPKLIQSESTPNEVLEGTIVYQRKSIHDDFSEESVLRRDIRNGQIMKMHLYHDEMLELFKGIRDCYDVYSQMDGIPNGTTKFIRTDIRMQSLMNDLKETPELVKNLVKVLDDDSAVEVLKFITKEDSNINFTDLLISLQSNEISKIENAVNYEKLRRLKKDIEANLENSKEEYWQKLFTNNQWIISELISVPISIFSTKAYYGGKSIHNEHGNLGDLLYKNQITNNVVIVEIKTPLSSVIGSKYRNNTYSISDELTGGINQLLNSRDSLRKEYYTISAKTKEPFEVLEPKCLLLIGKLSSLEIDQVPSFEMFRNSLNNIQIITFDELLKKIENLISLLIS